MGKLSQAQVERVREYAERAPLIDELRDRDRKRLQARSARASCARARRSKRLPEQLANWERGREPAFVAALEAWREQYFALLIDIDRSLTPEQRARALRPSAPLRRRLRRRSAGAMNDPKRCASREPSAAADPAAPAYAGRTRYTQLEYEALLANASIGIAFTRERRFFLCNPKFAEMFGYGPDELIGSRARWCTRAARATWRSAQIAVPMLSAGRQLDVEWEVRRKDGSTFLAA